MNKTKRKIFNAAIKLFAEKGYDNASTQEITASAGVAKGSLYYHFQKKEDILDTMLREGMNLLKNSIEIKTKKCNTAMEKVKAIILIEIKVVIKYEQFINIVLSQICGEEEKNKKCKQAVLEYIKLIEPVIQEGIDNGEFYENDVEALSSVIFGVTTSSLIYNLKKNREPDVEKIYSIFVDSVIKILSKK